MNSSIEFQLIKRFRQLAKDREDLDFRFAQWCKDARAAEATDAAFIKWCQLKLELTDYKAHEMLQLAGVAALASDAHTFETLGGPTGAKLIPVLALPKREQVAVVQAAKLEVRSIRSVMQARGHITPITPAAIPAQEKKRISDVALLAKYIAEHLPNARLPSDVQTIVLMYVPSFGKKRAA